MLRNEIELLRNRIDSIDNDILSLISQRQACAIKIGTLKDELRASSAEEKLGAYDSKREAEILHKLAASSKNLSATAVEAIFREIISFCRNSAHKAVICVLSEDCHFLVAAREHFGKSSDYKCFADEDEFLDSLFSSPFNIALVSQNISGETLVKMQNNGYILNGTITVPLDKEMAKAQVFAHR